MDDKSILTGNTDRLHTTQLGAERIKKNLGLGDVDPVEYCKSIVNDPKCIIYREGKNWYCECGSARITINTYSYTVITAHKRRQL